MQGVKGVYGGGAFGWVIKDDEDVRATLDALEAGGVKAIDTAQIYPGSEEILGKANAGARFAIDTKTVGGYSAERGHGSRERVFEDGKKSLSKLGVDKVDVFYMHAPIPGVPIASTLAGIQDLYLAGGFSRFGLSNFSAEEVLEVHSHCKEQGYVLPTVFQGNYSAFARKPETLLLPTLRKLGIAFYAYSPVAGGFLAKSKEQIEEAQGGRFVPGDAPGAALFGIYHKLYVKPSLLNALDEWGRIAEDEGCSRAELAYRWTTFNSALKPEHGDAVVFGASSIEQLKVTLQWLRSSPLQQKSVERIDALWKSIAEDAPLDNYNDFVKPLEPKIA